jgi:hypothetical protein
VGARAGPPQRHDAVEECSSSRVRGSEGILPTVLAPANPSDAPQIQHQRDRRRSPSVSSRIDWAELLKRTYDIDALACSCGGRLSFIATILDPPVAQSILASLGLPATAPPMARARSPDSFDELQLDAHDC